VAFLISHLLEQSKLHLSNLHTIHAIMSTIRWLYSATLLVWFEAACCSSFLSTIEYNFRPSAETAAQRGPQIFNAVYDSMRKLGSSFHCNGMSIYLATVPEGVLFHHGNARNATPTTLDWLAYEIEHAEMFARPAKHWKPEEPLGRRAADGLPMEVALNRGEDAGQTVLAASAQEPELSPEGDYGWLHTYRTTRALSFLYVDGMSGNKGSTGDTDTQEYILRANQTHKQTARPIHSPPGEFEMAEDMCKLCAEWGLQGIIRIEWPGYEVIKCDFLDGLEEVQSLRRQNSSSRPPGHRPPGRKPGHGDGDYPRKPPYGKPPGGRPGGMPGGGDPSGDEIGSGSPEDAFRDVGSDRTVLDYSSMVSAFFFPIDISNPNDTAHEKRYPRLVSSKPEHLSAIKDYLERVVAKRRTASSATYTWRDVADLVVRRYAADLATMVNVSTTAYAGAAVTAKGAKALTERTQFLLNVFLDYAEPELEVRNAAGQARCTTFYIQTKQRLTESDDLIYAAFEAVNARICAALFQIKRMMVDTPGRDAGRLVEVNATLRELIEYLDWSVFQRY
jgi:hypothetical protein